MSAVLKKYIWIFGLVCTVVASFLLAKMATLWIEGHFFPNAALISQAPTQKNSASDVILESAVDLDVIIKRNFFNAVDVAATNDASNEIQDPVETPPDETVNSDVAVPTTLDIKLVSTISVGDGTTLQSSCVINANRKADTYTLKNDKSFATNTKIVRILAKRVEFTNAGKLEYVELEKFAVNMNKKPEKVPTKVTEIEVSTEETPTEIAQDGDTFKIPRSERDAALAHLDKLYTDARAVPYYIDGKPNGFKLLSVKRGSFFDKLGLRRGDILKSINGKVLEISTGMETFNSLKDLGAFELELQRKNEDKTFKYEII